MIGAADVIREFGEQRPFVFGQLISSMDDPWPWTRTLVEIRDFHAQLEAFSGRTITDDMLRESIRVHNRGRQLMRRPAHRPDVLTDKQKDRWPRSLGVEDHVEVEEATWGIYQRMIAAYRKKGRSRWSS